MPHSLRPSSGSAANEVRHWVDRWAASGRLDSVEMRRFVEAAKQLAAEHADIVVAVSRLEATWPGVTEALNAIHRLTTGQVLHDSSRSRRSGSMT